MGCVSGCPQLVPIGTRTIRHVIKAMYVCMLLTKNNVKATHHYSVVLQSLWAIRIVAN